MTTPCGELRKRYARRRGKGQPVEDWLTERELRSLFERSRFVTRGHDRAYGPERKMGLLHEACAVAYKDRRVSRYLARFGLTGAHKALQYSLGLYQVWWFRLGSAAQRK